MRMESEISEHGMHGKARQKCEVRFGERAKQERCLYLVKMGWSCAVQHAGSCVSSCRIDLSDTALHPANLYSLSPDPPLNRMDPSWGNAPPFLHYNNSYCIIVYMLSGKSKMPFIISMLHAKTSKQTCNHIPIYTYTYM